MWITFEIFPEVAQKAGLAPTDGGLVTAYARALADFVPEVELAVAAPCSGKTFRRITTGGVTCFLLPKAGCRPDDYSAMGPCWQQVRDMFAPEVIHIHGSEYPLGLSWVRMFGAKGVVLSMQGLVSVIEKYYYGGIPVTTLLRNVTPRDIVRFDTLFDQRRRMRTRGRLEAELIRKISHVIGRTGWDRGHSWAINPDINYHFCNEILRANFFEKQGAWRADGCEKHSVFLSQGQYPIKGLHRMVEALPSIVRQYPDVKVYVAGSNLFTGRELKIHGYAKYVNRLIAGRRLEKHFVFLGPLSAQEMVERYLLSNVFVCPSAIENGCLSVGEAQMLGVPCVGAYVGGVGEITIDDGASGLVYRYDEPEQLAWNICRIFADASLVARLSAGGNRAAMRRFDRQANANGLLAAYKSIVEE